MCTHSKFMQRALNFPHPTLTSKIRKIDIQYTVKCCTSKYLRCSPLSILFRSVVSATGTLFRHRVIWIGLRIRRVRCEYPVEDAAYETVYSIQWNNNVRPPEIVGIHSAKLHEQSDIQNVLKVLPLRLCGACSDDHVFHRALQKKQNGITRHV